MKFQVGMLLALIVSLPVFADGILPSFYQLPRAPAPGASGCASCGSGNSEGNEIPYVDSSAMALMRINLMEEAETLDLGRGLLAVMPGGTATFAPESRYILQPPGDPAKNEPDYLRVLLWEVPLRFRAKFDELGQSSFFSYTRPGYSLRRDGNYLIVINHNDHLEYRFTSLDGGQTWKIDSIQRQNAPATRISCKYNNDGLITEIILPGNRKYLVEYRYGQPVKVTSPAGAVTTLEWSEAGTLKRLTTVLTPTHPLYAGNAKPAKRGKTALPVVRDLHFTCAPQGTLQEVTNTTGEHYTVKSWVEKKPDQVDERTTIITYPDGSRKFKRNAQGPKIGKVVTDGVVVNQAKGDQFVTVKQQEFVRVNNTWISKGTQGATNEYKAGSLAVTAHVDAYGNRTEYTYNPCGLQTSATYPDKAKKTWEYDARWNKTKEVDECGRVKTWSYSPDGLLTQYQYGDLVTRYHYDDQGRPVKTIAPGNLVHQFVWDDNSRMTSYTRPDGVITEYRYYGDLAKIKELSVVANDQSQKYTRSYSYDVQERLKQIAYPDQTKEEFAYDCCNMIAQKDRAGVVRRYAYNQQKQKIRDIGPMGEVTTYEYDPIGNLKKVIYPNQTSTEYLYAEDGTLLGIAESNRLPVRYESDKMDRLTVTKRSDGAISRQAYDKRGRLTQISGDLERNIAYSYDPSGNIIKAMDWGVPKQKKARISQYTFDSVNRQISSSHDGTVEQTIYLPGTPWLDHIVNTGIYRFFQYDQLGRQVSSATVTQPELHTATGAESRKQLILAKRHEFKHYDVYGNLTEVRNGRGKLLARYSFAPDGQIETVLRPTSDSLAELQTYKHYYNQKGEQIFEIYQKNIPMEEKL